MQRHSLSSCLSSHPPIHSTHLCHTTYGFTPPKYSKVILPPSLPIAPHCTPSHLSTHHPKTPKNVPMHTATPSPSPLPAPCTPKQDASVTRLDRRRRAIEARVGKRSGAVQRNVLDLECRRAQLTHAHVHVHIVRGRGCTGTGCQEAGAPGTTCKRPRWRPRLGVAAQYHPPPRWPGSSFRRRRPRAARWR